MHFWRFQTYMALCWEEVVSKQGVCSRSGGTTVLLDNANISQKSKCEYFRGLNGGVAMYRI